MLFALSAVMASALVSAADVRELSFEQRVEAQRAIELVYHSHRTGSRRSFDQAVPRALLETKVRRYLEQSAALDAVWHRPITAEALERELERMARSTLFPERLEEIYGALGHDAFLVEECFVRPVLAGRLVHNLFVGDGRIHAGPRRAAEELHERLVAGRLDPNAEHPQRRALELAPGEFELWSQELERGVSGIGPVHDNRASFSVTVFLSEQQERVRLAVYSFPKVEWDSWWEDERSGLEAQQVRPVARDGMKLPSPGSTAECPAADTWANGLLDDAPSRRTRHTAVWTGTEMIVWGGETTTRLNTGGRYDPLTDTWMPTSTVGAPAARADHTAIWTGSRMIVWGGRTTSTGGALQTGGRYDPVTDTWAPTSQTGAPQIRYLHSAVWSGGEMIVWGGLPSTNTGGRYDPLADTWTPTAATGAPSARSKHAAVWTGSEMVVFGGSAGSTGGRYDPLANAWAPTSTVDAPAASFNTKAVWTGEEMLVWPESARYDPTTDTWSDMSTLHQPPSAGQSVAWTGSEMIVWSRRVGLGDFSIYFNTGARYDPAADVWTPTETAGAPPGRRGHRPHRTCARKRRVLPRPRRERLRGRTGPAGGRPERFAPCRPELPVA